SAVALSAELEAWLGFRISPTAAYDHPTIESLSGYLAGLVVSDEAATDPKRQCSVLNEPVAIVAINCRFPGADDPESFWQLLRDGVDAVTELPPERWNVRASHEATLGAAMAALRWGGFLREVDQFRPQFFGLSPREALTTEPQQRLLLEVSWVALERAGIAPERLAGSSTGVFIGISTTDYSHLLFDAPSHVSAYAGSGTAFSVAANRLSYLLDLHGPS